MDDFKYDIAISFLATDEPVAMDIYGKLKERYNIFVYGEQQKNLAGKDGEGAFRKVFEHEAKLVVVLYRSEWGTTPWTRMEQQGIRDRAYKFGYDFVTFIALEEKPAMPDWFPKQRLYASYPRFGVDQSVAVIDSRAQEAQIQSRELTVLEQAEIFEKHRNFEKARHAYLNSHEGGHAIQAFWTELHGLLSQRFAKLKEMLPTLGIEEKPAKGYFVITGEGPVLTVFYRQSYINDISGSELHVGLHKGFPKVPGYHYFGDSEEIKTTSLKIDRTEAMPLCWHGKGQHYSNEEAADYIAKFWLEAQPNGRR